MNVLEKIKSFNVFEILLIIILISLPIGGYAINSIAVILFFLVALFKYFVGKQKITFNRTSVLLIGLYILCLLSLLWTDNLGETKAGLERFLSYLVLPFAFSLIYNERINKEKVIEVFAYSLVLVAVYCLFLGTLTAILKSDISYLFYHNLSSHLSKLNAIYLSVFISLGICFFLNKKEKSKLEISCLALLSLFLILLSSKTIITTTFVLGFIFFLKNKVYKKINFNYILVILSVTMLFLLASTNILNRVKLEFEKTKISEVLEKKDFGPVYLWTGVGLRVFQARAFFEILQEQKHIFLGSGLNNSQKLLNNKYKEYNLYSGFLNYNYHNQYLQIFAELGAIGLCLLLLILSFSLKEAIIFKDYFLFCFIILILVVCITESFLWRQRGMVFFITISLLYSKRKRYKS